MEVEIFGAEDIIYKKSIERRLYSGPNKFERVYRSIYWEKE